MGKNQMIRKEISQFFNLVVVETTTEFENLEDATAYADAEMGQTGAYFEEKYPGNYKHISRSGVEVFYDDENH